MLAARPPWLGVNAASLRGRPVEKVWGRRALPGAFDAFATGHAAIGEIWFEDERADDRALLVKYLFTSDRLSIQVHPDDAGARAIGLRCGKDEAWVVIEAEPGAAIALGPREPMTRDALRAAARDGRIEQLLDWRPARVGDVYYSPGGTIHALGPGLSVIEVQQNIDVTYRLYDYGRPRELQIEQAVAVANLRPYAAPPLSATGGAGRERIAEGPAFTLERWSEAASGTIDASADAPVWLIPFTGAATVDACPLESGAVWIADGPADLEIEPDSAVLIAIPRPGHCR